MWPFLVVVFQVNIKILLHFLDGFVELFPAHDPQVFIEKGSVKTFDKSVTLRSSDLGGSVFDVLQLKEQFIGMVVFPSAELSAVVPRGWF